MGATPTTISTSRLVSKKDNCKVKWAYRPKDCETEGWSEWTPSCSRQRRIWSLQWRNSTRDDPKIMRLSANILYNMFGRGVREGKRQSSRKALPENLQITRPTLPRDTTVTIIRALLRPQLVLAHVQPALRSLAPLFRQVLRLSLPPRTPPLREAHDRPR